MKSNLIPEYLPLPQLQKVTQHLNAHAFCPGTSRNHPLQTQSFIQFCDHYHLCFLDPDVSTICLYITHLTHHFSSARSICNYMSGVRTIHKEMRLTPPALESFQVSCLLWAADISMRTPPLQCLSILPPLLHRICSITYILGFLGPGLQVCLTFCFFTMLRQLKLVPLSASQFDPSRHTRVGGGIFMAHPGLQILVWWTKTHQSVGRASVLPIPEVPGHPADLVTACCLLTASPTTSADQPLLTYIHQMALHYGHCPHPGPSPGHPPP